MIQLPRSNSLYIRTYVATQYNNYYGAITVHSYAHIQGHISIVLSAVYLI